MARIGDEGIEVIKAVYPHPTERADSSELRSELGAPGRLVTHQGRSEIVLAIDLPTLVALARQHDGVIEFMPQVGDFVAADEPLFVLYGGAAAIADEALRANVAFGPERTLEQDPMFAFRILVDIGLKALSPAINDPTTGVLAIDQVHRLLRFLGRAAPAARRHAGCRRTAARDLPDAELGGLRPRRVHRDSRLRGVQRADRATAARDAPESGPGPAVASA